MSLFQQGVMVQPTIWGPVITHHSEGKDETSAASPADPMDDIVVSVYQVDRLPTYALRRRDLCPPPGTTWLELEHTQRVEIVSNWKTVYPLLCRPTDEETSRLESQLHHMWEWVPRNKTTPPGLPAWMHGLRQTHIHAWNHLSDTVEDNPIRTRSTQRRADSIGSFSMFYHDLLGTVRVPPSLKKENARNMNEQQRMTSWLTLFQFAPFIPYFPDWLNIQQSSGRFIKWMARYWSRFVEDRLRHLYHYQCVRKQQQQQQHDSKELFSTVLSRCWTGTTSYRNDQGSLFMEHFSNVNVIPWQNNTPCDNMSHPVQSLYFWRYYWRQSPPTRLWRFMQVLWKMTPDASLRGATIELSLPYDADDLAEKGRVESATDTNTQSRYRILASVPPERSDVVSIYCQDVVGVNADGQSRPLCLVSRLFLQDTGDSLMDSKNAWKSARYLPQQRTRSQGGIPGIPKGKQLVVAWRTQFSGLKEPILDYFMAVSTLFTVSELPCNCAFGDPRLFFFLDGLKQVHVSSLSIGLLDSLLPWNTHRGIPPLCECRCGHGLASVLSYRHFWSHLYNIDMYRASGRRWIYLCLMTYARDFQFPTTVDGEHTNNNNNNNTQAVLHWSRRLLPNRKINIAHSHTAMTTTASSVTVKTIPPECADTVHNSQFFTHDTTPWGLCDRRPRFPSCRRTQAYERQLKLFMYSFTDRLMSHWSAYTQCPAVASYLKLTTTGDLSSYLAPRGERTRIRTMRNVLNGILGSLPPWLTRNTVVASNKQLYSLLYMQVLTFSWSPSELLQASESTVVLWWKHALQLYTGILYGLYDLSAPVIHIRIQPMVSPSALLDEGILHPNIFHSARRLIQVLTTRQHSQTDEPKQLLHEFVHGWRTSWQYYAVLAAWIVGFPSGVECPYALYCTHQRHWYTLLEHVEAVYQWYSSVQTYIQRAIHRSQANTASLSYTEHQQLWKILARVQYQQFGKHMRGAWVNSVASGVHAVLTDNKTRNTKSQQVTRLYATSKQQQQEQMDWKDLLLTMMKSSIYAHCILRYGGTTKEQIKRSRVAPLTTIVKESLDDDDDDDNAVWKQVWNTLRRKLSAAPFSLRSSSRCATGTACDINALDVTMNQWCIAPLFKRMLAVWLTRSCMTVDINNISDCLHHLADACHTRMESFHDKCKHDTIDYPSRRFVEERWDALICVVEWTLMTDIVLQGNVFGPLCESMSQYALCQPSRLRAIDHSEDPQAEYSLTPSPPAVSPSKRYRNHAKSPSSASSVSSSSSPSSPSSSYNTHHTSRKKRGRQATAAQWITGNMRRIRQHAKQLKKTSYGVQK